MSIEGDDVSLEDALDAALDAGKEPIADETPETADAVETPEQEQARYVREGRRFVKEQKEEPAAAKAQETPEQQAAAQLAKVWKPTWLKPDHGEWDKYPDALRKQIEQREKEYAQGIEKHATSAKAWEPVAEALKPFEQQMRAQGIAPQQYVGQLIEADKYLRAEPVQAINWLIQQYLPGYDIHALADWMHQNQVQTQKVDPLQQKITALEQKITQMESIPQQQMLAATNATISEWSKDKPHYAKLERTIMGLIQADPDVRQRFRVDPKATLDSLYEQASYAHPGVRESILNERDKAREDQRLADLKRARAAGAQSPRTGAAPNGATGRFAKLNTTVEEDIAAALDGAV